MKNLKKGYKYRMKSIRIFILFMGMVFIAACTERLDPMPLGWVDDDEIWDNIEYTHGIINMVYEDISQSWVQHMGISADYYTDNAVENRYYSDFAMTGGNPDAYPLGDWSSIYENILHINIYLENGLETPFTGGDPELDSIGKARFYGEAHFLRAWLEAELLKQYGGPVDGAGSQMMGYPIVRTVYENDQYSSLPRSSYDECLQAILDDLDEAYGNLPLRNDGSGTSYDAENKRGRATQLAVLALKARVLLYAASDAFNSGQNNDKWSEAVQAAFLAISEDGGLQTLEAYGEFNNTNSTDHFWRTDYNTGSTLESNHFPPSLYGNGSCNPSQNLVDAFPMANGYPIDDPGSGYDASDPYAGRDQRFYDFIAYNGDSIFGYRGPVQTFDGGRDAPGVISTESTRTGYFMKRFLSDLAVGSDPNRLSGVTTTSQKFAVFFDREELYLNFAEAANEVAGSDPQTALSGLGIDISALDALQAVRARGGSNDYIDALIAGGTLNRGSFRDLVRNERRIELCFRGHRYWDLRRWNTPLNDLNEAVMGVKIVQNADGSYSYSEIEVEQRGYGSNAYYGPIPYTEIANSTSLVQNYGW